MDKGLPDIQRMKDDRGIAIDQVGVSHIRFPMVFPCRDGGDFHTVAEISMRVNLPHGEKGTHMSRFLLSLQDHKSSLAPSMVREVLAELLKELDAETAYLDMTFPIFLSRKAPVTGLKGLIDFDCHFKGVLTRDGVYDKMVGVDVTATSLCPCSKDISEFGAHNQRSLISLQIREGRRIVWFEDLIDIAECNASCPAYPILKRPDEKFVTEQAFKNPKFVEDVVRDVALDLQAMMDMGRVQWFRVSCTNFESIHTHNAFAQIQCGDPGCLLLLG